MSVFHEDAITGATDLNECVDCRIKFGEIVHRLTTDRNFTMFFTRYDATGRIINSIAFICARFGLSTATVRHTLRAIWRKVQGYHMDKCRRGAIGKRLYAMRIPKE